MPVNDPVGDMLTRLRNASRARHDKVVMPASKLKVEVAKVLKDEGFIADYVEHERKPQGEITVVLKYGPDREPGDHRHQARVASRACAATCRSRDIPRVLGGLGIAILSTSQGVMVDSEARKQNVGGELLCTVW